MSRTDLELPGKHKTPHTGSAGKSCRVSPWDGQTIFFFTYPDQLLNIEDLPSGTYRLKFVINPSDRFDESDMTNNTSSAVIRLDMEKRNIGVVSEEPAHSSVEHVYPEQNCAACTL